MTIILISVFLVAGVFGFHRWSKQQNVKTLLTTSLTDHQRTIVADHVPLTQKLPAEYHDKLEGKMQKFMNQVEYIGCDGLEVTEEMQLSIAAQACLLIVNTDTWYKYLRTILIYPGAFKSRRQKHDGYVVTEEETVRLGESWARGPVILSWSHTEQGAIDFRDGHNVALHEFAHQLDDLSGHTDGAPVMNKGQSFAVWAHVFTTAYENHVKMVEAGHKTLIDPYGATGQEEFFAVSVEVFFEKPKALKREQPAIYEQLAELFQLEPINWK